MWLARRHDPDGWPALRRRSRRALTAVGVVVALAWVQPLVEQFTSSGTGNLTRLARAARAAHVPTVGFHLGTKLVAAVVSLPPLWFRPSVEHTFAATGWHPPSLTAALDVAGDPGRGARRVRLGGPPAVGS